jgi:APA family basic amino acid/polyamine antiporter
LADKSKPFTRQATGLVREFSILDSFGFEFGGIVTVVGLSTLFVAFSFLLGANILISLILLLPILVCYYIVETQLSSAMPRSGGDYVYTSRILHPSLGLVTGWVQTFLLILNPAIFSGLIVTAYVPGFLDAVGMTSAASSISGTATVFILDNVIMAICFGLVIIPVRHYAKIQKGLLVLAVLGAILVPIALLAIGHGGFVSAFNAKSPVSYDSVISKAQSLGFTQSFSWLDTVLAIPGLAFFLITNWPATVGGELRNPGKSITFGIFVGFFVSWIIFFSTAALYYQVLGSNFASSIAFLSTNSPSNTPFGGTIVLTSIIQYVYGLNAITFLIAISLIAACFLVIAQSILLSTRFVFAWAFDRVIPSRFSNVNAGTGTPVFTTLVLWVIAEIVLLLELFESSAIGVYLNAALGVVAFPIITCLAAILFPRLRKQLYQGSPSMTRLKIGSVPVVVIAGVIGLAGLAVITGFVVAFPQAGSPVTPSNVGFMALMFVLGALVYFIGYAARKRQGMDISLAFKEIPPE